MRYVDDLLLFGNDKATLWQWHEAVVGKLAELRLTSHPNAQPRPVTEGVPFLGFVVYPTHRLVKRRKVVYYRRKLRTLLVDYQRGNAQPERIKSSVLGWINHVRYGDTWGLRRSLLRPVKL